MSSLVAVVGATGAVGRAFVSRLAGDASFTFRLGGRNEFAGRMLSDAHANCSWMTVDVRDDMALARFCDGAAIVVNCAGPARLVGCRVAHAADDAGADVVDVGASGGLVVADARNSLVIEAGMFPGLSGLLPRFVVQDAGMDTVTSITAYLGGCDRLTEAAAADYLDSLSNGTGETNAMWSSGRRISATSAERMERALPFFPRAVIARPYLTVEAERLAQTLGATRLEWHAVFDSPRALSALPRCAASRDAAGLARASSLDTIGRAPYQLLVVEVAGARAGESLTRSLALRARSGAELTGVAAAAAVRCVATAHDYSARGCFAEVLDPQTVVADIITSPAVTLYHAFDGPLGESEEGAL
jgi:hypothetical protein